jgi:hypothetical protein
MRLTMVSREEHLKNRGPGKAIKTADSLKLVLRCRYCFTLTDLEITICDKCADLRV